MIVVGLCCSPQLESLTYTADSPAALHAVVMVLPTLAHLSALSLTARGFAIPPETARLIGRLPLLSLRLDSAVYESQVRLHATGFVPPCQPFALITFLNQICGSVEGLRALHRISLSPDFVSDWVIAGVIWCCWRVTD